MSERCYLEITVPTAHRDHAGEILGAVVDHENENVAVLVDEQANYGSPQKRQMLADEGIDFMGFHGGVSGCFTETLFAALGGEHVEVTATDDCVPFVEVCAEDTFDDVKRRIEERMIWRYYEMREAFRTKYGAAS